jgi:hypothetical protein
MRRTKTNLPNGNGDCYEANANYFLEHYLYQKAKERSVWLCHGSVRGSHGTKVEGLIFGHCWIEVGDLFMDFSNGKSTIVRKEIQYAKGDIIEESVRRYTPRQTARNLLRYRHYGAWE